MKLALYEAIRAFVEKREDGKLEEAETKFGGVSAETIYCIYAQDVQRRVRASHSRHRKKVDEYLIRYRDFNCTGCANWAGIRIA